MKTLKEECIRLLSDGITSLEEVWKSPTRRNIPPRSERMKIDDLLKQVVKLGASDLHITVGVPCTVRVHGKLQFLDDRVLTPEDTKI